MAISPTAIRYLDVANAIADTVGLCPDTDAIGALTQWTADNQRKISRFAARAAEWAYYPPNPDVKWPGLLVGVTATLSSGAFNLSVVDYSTQFSLYSEDPRPFNSVGYAINATIQGDLIYPTTTLSSVFALYQPRPPQYTNVAWGVGTTYAVGDVVYYTDGRCYRCVLVPPVATVPTNTTYWLAQDCLRILSEAVVYQAASYFQGMGGVEPEASARNENNAQYELDTAWQRIRPFANTCEYDYLTTSTIVTPTPLAVNAGYWTAYTGGTATCVDYIVTANGAVVTGSVIETAISGDAATWQLQAGTAAEDGVTIIRPDDYNASTNARIWVRIA